MDQNAASWFSSSDAMVFFRDVRDYVSRQMSELESANFPRVASLPSAPLSALKHNLRATVAEFDHRKLQRVASNAYVLMAFCAFEYALSQALQVFLGASPKNKKFPELNFTESRDFLDQQGRKDILASNEWRLIGSLQIVRHAIAHRGSIIELSDAGLEPLREAFSPLLILPIFEGNDKQHNQDYAEAEIVARERQPCYVTFRQENIDLIFNRSEVVLRNLLVSISGAK